MTFTRDDDVPAPPGGSPSLSAGTAGGSARLGSARQHSAPGTCFAYRRNFQDGVRAAPPRAGGGDAWRRRRGWTCRRVARGLAWPGRSGRLGAAPCRHPAERNAKTVGPALAPAPALPFPVVGRQGPFSVSCGFSFFSPRGWEAVRRPAAEPSGDNDDRAPCTSPSRQSLS